MALPVLMTLTSLVRKSLNEELAKELSDFKMSDVTYTRASDTGTDSVDIIDDADTMDSD